MLPLKQSGREQILPHTLAFERNIPRPLSLQHDYSRALPPCTVSEGSGLTEVLRKAGNSEQIVFAIQQLLETTGPSLILAGLVMVRL